MPHNGPMRLRYGALLWGIGIYALLSLAWSGFVIYGYAQGIAPRLFELAILVILAYIAGRALGFGSWKDVLPYSILWALEAVALDAIYTVPFSGWSLYANISIWAGYATLAIVPLFGTLFRRTPSVPAHLTA